jgi:methyl-accepting chemotaxis protein
MRWFSNLSTFAKLIGAFGLLGLILLSVACLAVIQLDKLQTNTNEVYKNGLLPLVALSDLQDDVQRLRQDTYRLFATVDRKEITEIIEAARALDRDVAERNTRYLAGVTNEQDRATFAKFQEAMTEWRHDREEKLYPQTLGGQREAGYQIAKDIAPRYEVAVKLIKEIIKANQESALAKYENSENVFRASRITLLALSAAGVVLGLALAWVIARSAVYRIGVAIAAINDSAQQLASSSQELTSVSQVMAANAEETATQANVASAAAQQVSKNVATVSAGTEEMGVSIKEIAKSTNEAAKIATSAVKVAGTTNAIVSKLGDSSAEIGNVVKVITSIAEQTNLLALNATIEAARAGEAGKGFAVVANEVKELAKQTAKATEEIRHKIEAIQTDTKGAVEAIAQIGKVINQINDIQNTIASAVEEQSVTTGEISRNVSEAAAGSNEIARNISGVAEAARSTTEGAGNTKSAADQLATIALDLQGLVSRFKY